MTKDEMDVLLMRLCVGNDGHDPLFRVLWSLVKKVERLERVIDKEPELPIG